MCGIVGAVAQRDIAEILLEGLRRLVLRIPAGRPTVSHLKATHTRMCLNTSWWCITALSKTTNRCVKN